jgi:hypothetical protein
MTTMDDFRFFPELFESRQEALEILDGAGFYWLADFASVEVLHETYGIEVTGIPDEALAREALSALRRSFSDWEHVSLVHQDCGREPGWKVRLHRDEENEQANRDHF